MDNKNTAAKAAAKLEQERVAIPKVPDNEIGTRLRGKDAEATKASLMADAVMGMLVEFCEQNEQFAEAVLAGGSFTDCMKAVTKGLGNYTDGISTCRKAVQFYVPGAEVKPLWSITMPSQEGTGESGKKQAVILDLADFFN